MATGRAKMKENIAKLTRERDRLLGDLEALKHKISGVELAISLPTKEDGEYQVADTSARGAAKTILLDLLREVGTTGLNAATAVDIASRRGIKLDRGSAASILSRLKKEGIVAHDGDRYRLPEFTRQPTLAVVIGKNG
jgi:hypothetical protein